MKTCRNKETLLNLMDGRQYMLDSLDVYSLRDLIDAISGSLLPFMYNIMEKFIAHVTKTCMVCQRNERRGRGEKGGWRRE